MGACSALPVCFNGAHPGRRRVREVVNGGRRVLEGALVRAVAASCVDWRKRGFAASARCEKHSILWMWIEDTVLQEQ